MINKIFYYVLKLYVLVVIIYVFLLYLYKYYVCMKRDKIDNFI